MNKFLSSKTRFVKDLFEDIAPKYDILNDIISLGMHKRIKKIAVKNIPIKNDQQILDLCTGTGDIAVTIAENSDKSVDIIAVDFAENMLKIAEEKTKKYPNIKLQKTDAMNLPFEDNTFDAVFISFGLRNLENTEKALIETKRVTKKGGFISNLDTGKPKGIFKKFFNLYFFHIVPLLGQLIQKNFEAYKYLPESTEEFPSQEELVKIFEKIGLKRVKNHNFAFGTIAQQIGQK